MLTIIFIKTMCPMAYKGRKYVVVTCQLSFSSHISHGLQCLCQTPPLYLTQLIHLQTVDVGKVDRFPCARGGLSDIYRGECIDPSSKKKLKV